MSEKFTLFLNEVPPNLQEFVLELDDYLLGKECKRKIEPAKNGYVTTYMLLGSGKSLLNYVFRKTGMKIRIYAAGISAYDAILNDFPDKMKKEIIKAGDCKKLVGGTCSPICPAGYTFIIDGVEYKKCRNMAFLHNLDEESTEYILKLIKSELEKVCLQINQKRGKE